MLAQNRIIQLQVFFVVLCRTAKKHCHNNIQRSTIQQPTGYIKNTQQRKVRQNEERETQNKLSVEESIEA